MTEQVPSDALSITKEKLRQAKADVAECERVVKEERRREIAARNAKGALERAAHKESLAKQTGLIGHPKLDRLYDLAWTHGHSSGWSDIECYFIDFAELLQP